MNQYSIKKIWNSSKEKEQQFKSKLAYTPKTGKKYIWFTLHHTMKMQK